MQLKEKILIKQAISFLGGFMGKNDEYQCHSCKFVFPKKGATISGFESHPNGLHVHCPKCGALVVEFLKRE